MMKGFEIAYGFVFLMSARLRSENLQLLANAMRLEAFGDSHDPAMLHTWKQLWGSTDILPEREVLGVIARFIRDEGNWGPEDDAPQNLHDAIVNLANRGISDSKLMHDWENAISMEGDPYKARGYRIEPT
jgi:hypothetical protein